MKRLFCVVFVLMCLIIGCEKKAAALDLGKDFKLDGYVNVNAVVSDSYSAKINNVPIKAVEGDSKLVYVVDLGITWKNTIRPWITYLGVSAYTNWSSKADIEVPMMMTTIHAEPQSDTWTIGLLWRF